MDRKLDGIGISFCEMSSDENPGWLFHIWAFPKNRDTPKSSILIGFFIINHPFWGTPIFGNTHIGNYTTQLCGEYNRPLYRDPS